jgi:NAD(P)-dependent dehydrogenase (short-subunit alcohol dehydrogenase family)
MNECSTASIVTGGGRGIGRAMSTRLAKQSPVIVVGRTASDLESVCEEIASSGGHAVACVGDVTEPETAQRALSIAKDNGWRIASLVCNAGIGKSGPTATFDFDLWRNILNVNLNGCLHFVQACLPSMVDSRQGTICIISSISGVKGYGYTAAYTASKHALVGLARTLSQEYGKKGIVIVPICPSFVESEMTTRTIRGVMKRRGIPEQEAVELVVHENPQRRIIPAEEVAEMVAFVCSGVVPSLSGSPIMLTGGE